MEKNDFTLEEALDYVRSCRPAANPNASFIEQLRKYETALINGRAISSREGQATVERAVAGPSLGPLPAAPQQLRQQEEEEQAVRMEAEADGGLRSSSNVIPTQPPDLTGKILNGMQICAFSADSRISSLHICFRLSTSNRYRYPQASRYTIPHTK
jgi:hypothetical protein